MLSLEEEWVQSLIEKLRSWGVEAAGREDSLLMGILISQIVVCCSVAKLCLTLCDSMDCSTPGSSVFQYLLEFAQIHVH